MGKHKYLPSIDSLRAIAVISVIIYHCNASFLPGGFLGVDLFFVLSGYLISSLIIREFRETGKVDLWNFYIRRGRRLLPAVYFMITVILILMVIFNKPLLEKSHLDSLFGYAYSSNWWYIFHRLDYFDTFGAISPFKHLWSLAIEEQFYMIFPLLFLVTNLGTRKGKISDNLKFVVLVLIVLSLITHIYLFDFNDISRVYYGTDTRAFGLLVGVLGAIFLPMDTLNVRAPKSKNLIISAISLISIILFIVIMFNISEYSIFLYYGGFLLLSILFLIIIIFTGQQGTYMSLFMSFKPLVYIGKISYSLYLWHFPILVLTTPTAELGNPNLFYNFLRVILIFIVAHLSYKFIETPIRKNGFINYINYLSRKIMRATKKIRGIIFIILFLVLVFLGMGVFGKALPLISTAFVEENNGGKVREFRTTFSNDKSVKEPAKDYKENLKYEDKIYNKVLVIGDSLSVDIGEELVNRYAGSIVDGAVSRQLTEATVIANKYTSLNAPETAVIFILGTNGAFTDNQLAELLKQFDKSDIYFVNTKVPRNWEKTVNETLANNKDKYKNLNIVDWHGLAKDHSEYFAADGVHLEQVGITKLVDLISENLKHKIETPEMLEKIKVEEEAAKKAEQEKQQKLKQEQTKLLQQKLFQNQPGDREPELKGPGLISKYFS